MAEPEESPEPQFSVRLVSYDYYMSYPLPGYDHVSSHAVSGRLTKVFLAGHCEALGTSTGGISESYAQVPVIRVFGPTPAGQKACVHVHGVYPYFYIPFDEANDGRIRPEEVRRLSFLFPAHPSPVLLRNEAS
jgi:hypothetical protein